MQIISSLSEFVQYIECQKNNGLSIGFVPTMGALHNGHIQLVERAVSENNLTVVSVFVNPTQFNDKGDLAKYPRTLDADAQLLSAVGCDVVFAPNAEEFYSDEEMNSTFQFDFAGLDTVMEGKFRAGHFNGVVQVVSKLFTIVRPTKAYFGEKDFQQLAIINRMVEVMNFDVEIIGCPIVREESGLAMSSRNALLSDAERVVAANISAVLKESQSFCMHTTPKELISAATLVINKHTPLEVEYFDIVDGKTLQSVSSWDDAESVVGCIAVYCGKVRLIDNIRYK